MGTSAVMWEDKIKNQMSDWNYINSGSNNRKIPYFFHGQKHILPIVAELAIRFFLIVLTHISNSRKNTKQKSSFLMASSFSLISIIIHSSIRNDKKCFSYDKYDYYDSAK